MPCLDSAELGHALWDRLLAATSKPEAHLCKVALTVVAPYAAIVAEIACALDRRGGAIGFTTAAADEKKPVTTL